MNAQHDLNGKVDATHGGRSLQQSFISEFRRRTLAASLHLFTVSDNASENLGNTLRYVVVSEARRIQPYEYRRTMLSIRYSLAFNGTGDFANVRRSAIRRYRRRWSIIYGNKVTIYMWCRWSTAEIRTTISHTYRLRRMSRRIYNRSAKSHSYRLLATGWRIRACYFTVKSFSPCLVRQFDMFYKDAVIPNFLSVTTLNAE